ncbi:hypothetical protein FACS1894211_02690 [Clostridia bacterium]|nr:hypothetical protein FACS1894211_02690 [Clostridia bacterium]
MFECGASGEYVFNRQGAGNRLIVMSAVLNVLKESYANETAYALKKGQTYYIKLEGISSASLTFTLLYRPIELRVQKNHNAVDWDEATREQFYIFHPTISANYSIKTVGDTYQTTRGFTSCGFLNTARRQKRVIPRWFSRILRL